VGWRARLFLPSVLGRLRSPLASVIAPLSRGDGELSWVCGEFLWKHALRLGLRRAGPPQLRASHMLPSGGRTALASRAYDYFGADSSRPASLLCRLPPRRPGETTLATGLLASFGRTGSAPVGFHQAVLPTSLLHLWFPTSLVVAHLHAFPARSPGSLTTTTGTGLRDIGTEGGARNSVIALASRSETLARGIDSRLTGLPLS
jgi:hypothetical protein